MEQKSEVWLSLERYFFLTETGEILMTSYTPDQLLNLPPEQLGNLTPEQVKQRDQLIRQQSDTQIKNTIEKVKPTRRP
jgi:hypothetical protein